MDANRISVARLLELGVPLTWQEAVAITQEVCVVRVVTATLTKRPCKVESEACFLTRRGDVELPVPGNDGGHHAAQQLLRELLAGREIPEDLEALAFGKPLADLNDGLSPFSRPNRRAEIAALAQRGLTADAELRGVSSLVRSTPRGPAAPAAAAAPPPEQDRPAAQGLTLEEVMRLRAQTAPRSDEPVVVRVPHPPGAPTWKQAGVDQRAAAAGTVVVMVIAAAALGWSLSGQAATASRPRVAALPETALPETVAELPPHPRAEPVRTAAVQGDATPPPATPAPSAIIQGEGLPVGAPKEPAAAVAPPSVTARVAAAPSAARATAISTRAAPPPRAAATAAPAAARALPVPTRAAPLPSVAAAAPTPAGAVVPTPAGAVPSPPPAPPVMPASSAVIAPPEAAAESAAADLAVEAALSDTSVYAWTSSGVAPPEMTYPRMPQSAFPPASEAITGPHFEVLVDDAGGVEAVRLRGQAAPGETMYRYRMLLAAAKVWRFKPAMRDGRPVRYVIRVVIGEP